MSLKPYEILGLPDDYTLSEARSAYYSYSRDYHPDSSNYSFLSKKEKEETFIIIEQAYKEILAEKRVGEIDAPMFSSFDYEPDISIEMNNDIDTPEKFHEEFKQVHAKENYDNPWSIHYSLEKPSIDISALDIMRPDEYKTKKYYNYGVNVCADFTEPGKYTDINHLDKNNDVPETLLCTTLDQLLQDRETIEYSEEINQCEIAKQNAIKNMETTRRQVQLERDLRTLRLT